MTITQRKSNPIRSLYTRLGTVGFTKTYLKNVVLPEWWEDEIAENPAGYAQAVSIIARNLGLNLQSLQDQEGPIVRYDLGPRRFKHRTKVTEEELEIAECIALRAAQLACLATSAPARDLFISPSEFRSDLSSEGQTRITLETLIDTCWDCGIPVLHIAQFPPGVKKMDGIAARINGRAAIVLSCRRPYSAWLAFHLGHEMGHIGLGHLRDNDILVEDERQTTENSDEEKEANEYAIELLTGKPNLQYINRVRLKGSALAKKAIDQGRLANIDPGVLVLNYAKTMGDWAGATNTLKIIEPNPNAIALVHAKMCERLDWDRLPEESQAFLMRVTGADSDT